MAPSPEERRPYVLPLLAALTLSSLGIGVSLPIIPLFGLELGASPVVVGFIVSMRWATRLVADIPMGTASERLGRRGIFVGGVLLIAASGLVSATAPTWPVLLVARVLEGIGAGMSTTAGLASMADLSTPATRGRHLSAYQASQRIGFWFGPLIGGWVGAAIDLRAALWVYAGLALIATLPALAVRESRVAEAAHPSPFAALGLLARNHDFLLISAVSFVVFFTMTGAQFTALPLLAAEDLRLDADFVGWALFLSNTVGFVLLFPSGIISDRYGRRPIIIGLLGSMAVGLAVLAAAGDASMVLVASIIMGGGNALRGPAMQAYAMDAGRGGGHGASAGVFRAVGDLGSTLGPVLATAMIGMGFSSFFLLNAAITAVALFLFARWASTRAGEPATSPRANAT
ncbi:MAG TPA: MFS transporter [Vicinamibacterales bacterium]|nr:MFS transporter [Vicinamibacterales bacterium]